MMLFLLSFAVEIMIHFKTVTLPWRIRKSFLEYGKIEATNEKILNYETVDQLK